jgi:excisionase family DNA binding protein
MDGLVRVVEAARYLSVSRSKLYAMMDSGDLPYVKLGKSRRVAMKELLGLVERHAISRGVQETSKKIREQP